MPRPLPRPPLTLGALWALVDMASRVVGGAETPADPVETFRVLADHAVRFAALVPAMLLAVAAAVFGWRVRP